MKSTRFIQGFLEIRFDVAEKGGEWKARIRVKKQTRSDYQVPTYQDKGVTLYPRKTED